ncbi:MAG TPA: cobalamin biosynthesis protein [Nitrosopumilaceae archaeon]|nr:cobalamin biosynthesis protein [Nitrosopumilaceae archaeon]
MEKVSILAITKNGIKIGLDLKKLSNSFQIYAPSKFSDNNSDINWYSDSTGAKISELFKSSDALVCIFSLGAVIRLISPFLKDKKTDPAVLVIDDKAKFVISALSGHLGGANQLAEEIADKLGATPIVTTAADVNQTIAVDLLGKEFGWRIDDDSNVTRISAFMVNEEKIGVYQDAGNKEWWNKKLPSNVTVYNSLGELKSSGSNGYLIITDKKIEDSNILQNAVVYRPPSLVVGVGLHVDTTKETILEGLNFCLDKYKLALKSVAKLVSIKKKENVAGLVELANEMKLPVEYFEKEELATIQIPNPSETVQAFEGTPSVSEAAAIKSSGGKLVVEKQKFPPNLTVAIARIPA